MVKAGRDAESLLTVEQRNKFCVGDTLSILSPNFSNREFRLEALYDMAGEERESAPHPQEIVKLRCPYELQPGDMLRIRNKRT